MMKMELRPVLLRGGRRRKPRSAKTDALFSDVLSYSTHKRTLTMRSRKSLEAWSTCCENYRRMRISFDLVECGGARRAWPAAVLPHDPAHQTWSMTVEILWNGPIATTCTTSRARLRLLAPNYYQGDASRAPCTSCPTTPRSPC